MSEIITLLFIVLGLASLAIPLVMVRYMWVVPGKLDNIEKELGRIADAAEEHNKIERRRLANSQEHRN